MTKVRGKRGKLVHAWTEYGTRRDLAPSEIPNLICGKRLKAALVVDEEITCDACLDIIFNGN